MTAAGRVVAKAPFDDELDRTSWLSRPGSIKPQAAMSATSASNTRVYYLNGGSEVRFLAPDGSTGTATRIALRPYEEAGFSVSPDDSRIAVAVFSYNPPAAGSPSAGPTYLGMRLYAEDLNGGTHHDDIFSSTTIAEFPIGWTNGHLIISVSTALCCQSQAPNPYAATSYHVADPATGNRLATLCEGRGSGSPIGPVSAGGVVCLNGVFQRWDGSTIPPPSVVPNGSVGGYFGALAPDGVTLAVGGVDSVSVWKGSSANFPSAKGWVYGWLDAGHVVFKPIQNNALSVLDVNTGRSTMIAVAGRLVGTLPASVS